MKQSFESRDIGFKSVIETENVRDLPVVTAYIIRHGETTEDKLNPNRGLTSEGERQADEAAENLIAELDPQKDVVQIMDSGNYRANVTVMRIAEKLKAAGFNFFVPILSDKSGNLQAENVPTTSDPKSRSYHKIAATNIPDQFKKLLTDPVLHAELGLGDNIPDKRVATWFMIQRDGMETPVQVLERVRQGMNDTQKKLPQLNKILSPDQRIVVVAVGNASMVDSIVTEASKVHPKDRGGETHNCEGFKVDFNLDTDPKINLWGKNIEQYSK